MTGIQSVSKTPLSRRTFLRGVGATISLPLLDAMAPALADEGSKTAVDNTASPRRMIAIETNQGILPQYFFPKTTGRNYESTPYLKHLNGVRKQLTVFSGVSHPEVDGGHAAESCFLTAAPHPGRAGFRNSISLDQYAAERIGHLTRFPSLSLSINTRSSISYTGAGVQIPGDEKPSDVFKKLFVQGRPSEVRAQLERLRQGRSILDSVAKRAKKLGGRVGADDRAKLDQYFSSVRELERRLHKAEEWEKKSKPKVKATPPQDVTDPSALTARIRAMYDLAQLAVQTDSTRLITIYVYQNNVRPNIAGVEEGTHSLTHHGNRPEKLAQLRKIEEAQLLELARLLGGLGKMQERGETLLDRTMVLYGTPMGNANAHSNTNLPVLIAGGGFKHAGHLSFDKRRNTPLCNLYVSMLQRLGLKTDRFGSGRTTMTGLDFA